MSTSSLPPLSPKSTLREVLEKYPGAQRALFARYHIGGCRSCAFSPTETLEQLCARNENIPVHEVIEHIQSSYQSDEKLQISPQELASLLKQTPADLRLLDTRTREEFEAVKIPTAQLLTQDLVQEAFNAWPKETHILLYDHTGTRSLDVAAYFIGHGFSKTQCLAGGIDAYSREADSTLPRYRVELEA